MLSLRKTWIIFSFILLSASLASSQGYDVQDTLLSYIGKAAKIFGEANLQKAQEASDNFKEEVKAAVNGEEEQIGQKVASSTTTSSSPAPSTTPTNIIKVTAELQGKEKTEGLRSQLVDIAASTDSDVFESTNDVTSEKAVSKIKNATITGLNDIQGSLKVPDNKLSGSGSATNTSHRTSLDSSESDPIPVAPPLTIPLEESAESSERDLNSTVGTNVTVEGSGIEGPTEEPLSSSDSQKEKKPEAETIQTDADELLKSVENLNTNETSIHLKDKKGSLGGHQSREEKKANLTNNALSNGSEADFKGDNEDKFTTVGVVGPEEGSGVDQQFSTERRPPAPPTSAELRTVTFLPYSSESFEGSGSQEDLSTTTGFTSSEENEILTETSTENATKSEEIVTTIESSLSTGSEQTTESTVSGQKTTTEHYVISPFERTLPPTETEVAPANMNITTTSSEELLHNQLELSGYEKGEEPKHFVSHEVAPIKPEDAVGYDGISDERKSDERQADFAHEQSIVETDDKKVIPHTEAQFVESPEEINKRWQPYVFDCSKEVDEKGNLCQDWAEGGLCVGNRATMFLFCRKTCLCVGPQSLRRKH